MKGLTQKQEIFTLNLFKGMYQRAAYIDAYKPTYSISSIDENASRLSSNEKVIARLKELQQLTQDATIATVIERKQVLTEIVRGRFADFMTNLTKEKLQSAALQEIRIIEVGKDIPIKTTTIKLNDQVRAIAELNRMERIYEADGTVSIVNRILNIYVTSEKAKGLTQRLIEGERTGGDMVGLT